MDGVRTPRSRNETGTWTALRRDQPPLLPRGFRGGRCRRQRRQLNSHRNGPRRWSEHRHRARCHPRPVRHSAHGRHARDHVRPARRRGARSARVRRPPSPRRAQELPRTNTRFGGSVFFTQPNTYRMRNTLYKQPQNPVLGI